jgi:hypothetical protein
LEPLVRDSADREQLEAIRIFGARFLRDHRGLLARRAMEGRVRDVHGDLHVEHVCFAPEGIQIFDCVEFNPTLRRCDLASEIAFLLNRRRDGGFDESSPRDSSGFFLHPLLRSSSFILRTNGKPANRHSNNLNHNGWHASCAY